MCDPVGLQRRLSGSIGIDVSFCASPPAAGTVQISGFAPRVETKATVRLSGDQVGDESLMASPVVSCRGSPPAADTIQRFVVALLVSAFQVRSVKTMCWPSGDG